MAKPSKLQRMIKIARLYFEDNLTQDEIAKKMKISIPQVSRIITAAKDQGYVKTFVVDPFSEANDIRKQITYTFNLKDSRIVESRINDTRVTESNAAQATADYLLGILQTNDIVSLAFSNITSKIHNFLPKMHMENVSFVQPTGAVFEHVQGYLNDTVRETSNMLDAYYYYLPAPAMVQDKHTKDTLHQDPIIKWVIDKAHNANIALYSAVQPSMQSEYMKNKYLTPNFMDELRKAGAVADIFGHFIDINGIIVNTDIEERTIGMPISELTKKDYSICISTGEENAEAIYAALAGNYCNVLITDAVTARKVIEISEMHNN